MSAKLEALDRAVEALPTPPGGWPDDHTVRADYFAFLVGALSSKVDDAAWDECLGLAAARVHRQYGGVTA